MKRLKFLILNFKFEINEDWRNKFRNALEDDLNLPEALAVVWEAAKAGGDVREFDEGREGMVGPFLDTTKRVIFIAGNHDSEQTIEEIEKEYNIPSLQRYAFVINDVGFFGVGGANVKGMNYVSEKDMLKAMKAGFKYVQGAKKKVLVTHLHPAGSLIEKLSGIPGSDAITQIIYETKPDVHLCGHIHFFEGAMESMGKTEIVCLGKNGRVVEV